MNLRPSMRNIAKVLAGGAAIAILAPSMAFAQTGASSKAPAASVAAPSVLPGGAQAINEAFEDWMVACVQPDGTKRCAITQQQADAKTRQRLLAVELQPKADKVEGILVLPFGLLIDKGVTLTAGATEIASLRFKTCLPQGCLVSLEFDGKTLGVLRASTAPLTVSAFNDAGGPLTFSVSVKGFAKALDRAAALGK